MKYLRTFQLFYTNCCTLYSFVKPWADTSLFYGYNFDSNLIITLILMIAEVLIQVFETLRYNLISERIKPFMEKINSCIKYVYLHKICRILINFTQLKKLVSSARFKLRL